MTTKQLVLVLMAAGPLYADSQTVDAARAAHTLPYNGAEQFTKDTPGVAKVDANDPRRMQIKVAPQNVPGTTGLAAGLQGSSCGYHATKNGILQALALLQNADRAQYRESMQSTDYAHFLFGTPEAPWRQEIMKQRFKSVARKIYRRKIEEALKKDTVADKALLRHCINALEPVDPVFTPEGFVYRADIDLVYAQLLQRMETMLLHGSKFAPASVQLHQEKLTEFFDAITIEFTIALDGRCYEPHNPTKTIGQVSGDQYGKWVSSDEITSLVEHQRGTGLLQTQPRLLVATYGEDLGGLTEHAFASEKLSQLYALVTETDDDVVGVVLVYLGGSKPSESSTMQKIWSWFDSFSSHAEKLQSTQDRGHWISLVVSRIKGDMNYYALNSTNGNVLNHARVNELISYFDGKKELPGYEWTIGQTGKPMHHEATKKPSYRKTKLLLGGIGLGILGYYAYKWYYPGSALARKIRAMLFV